MDKVNGSSYFNTANNFIALIANMYNISVYMILMISIINVIFPIIAI